MCKTFCHQVICEVENINCQSIVMRSNDTQQQEVTEVGSQVGMMVAFPSISFGLSPWAQVTVKEFLLP
jgi:hypothetical protein